MRSLSTGLLLLLLLPLGGCVTTQEEEAAGDDPRYACNAGNLGGLVGRTASTQLGAEAMRTANARTIRWIRPGDMVTMDYRTDRLNIDLDAQNRVTRFRCG